MKTTALSQKEQKNLKKKLTAADDIILQLERSLDAIEKGRIREAIH